MTKLENTSVCIEYTDSELECPFCNDRIQINVVVNITEGSIRHVGTKNRDKEFAVSLSSNPAKVVIRHECHPKKVERE